MFNPSLSPFNKGRRPIVQKVLSPFEKGGLRGIFVRVFKRGETPLFYFLPPLLRDALPGEGEHKGVRYKYLHCLTRGINYRGKT